MGELFDTLKWASSELPDYSQGRVLSCIAYRVLGFAGGEGVGCYLPVDLNVNVPGAEVVFVVKFLRYKGPEATSQFPGDFGWIVTDSHRFIPMVWETMLWEDESGRRVDCCELMPSVRCQSFPDYGSVGRWIRKILDVD